MLSLSKVIEEKPFISKGSTFFRYNHIVLQQLLQLSKCLNSEAIHDLNSEKRDITRPLDVLSFTEWRTVFVNSISKLMMTKVLKSPT